MIVNYFGDHLAYTFESNDSMFMLGMRLVNKSEGDMISAVNVMHNNRIRLLYGIEGYRLLADVADTLNKSELAAGLIKFITSIHKIEDNDFLKITAIDINFNRLYYDVKNKSIKFVILPINYDCDFHDGETWSSSFRKTLIILFNYIFANNTEKLNEVYYVMNDNTKTDYEVIDYILKYESYIRAEENNLVLHEAEEEIEPVLVLEHNGEDGKLIFKMDKSEFIMGKSDNADAIVVNSNMVSRKHCKITKTAGNYFVEDLNSTNGTRINDYLLSPNEKYYLNNYDKLTLADVEFTVIMG